MRVDCDSFRGGERIEADVVIVGTGCAGIAAALGLLDSGRSVAMLESGTDTYHGPTQALYRGDNLGIDTFEIESNRNRLLGGTSTSWSGWCARLTALDFEERPGVPHSGWPLSLVDLEPHYATAEDLLGISPLWDAQAVAAAQEIELWVPDGPLLTNGYFQFAGGQRRLWERHGETLAAAADVTVYTHANLTEIVLDSNLASVDHLVCKRLDGTTFRVEAETFVLATGGIENARLLLASNRQIPGGVANSSDAVGRYFQEHPHLRRSVVWNGASSMDWVSVSKRHIDVDVPDHGAFSQDYLPWFKVSEDLRREEDLPDQVLVYREPHTNEDLDLGTVPPSAVHALAKTEGSPHLGSCDVICEQFPNPDSRVILHPIDVDALGMPRARLDWRILPEDLHSYLRGAEVIGAAIAEQHRGRLWMPDGPMGFDWRIGPGGHHMGTTRMSSDPLTGVVDTDCRCHDVPNLYILGSSVFPTSGAVNPTLTLLALTHRFVQHLLADQ